MIPGAGSDTGRGWYSHVDCHLLRVMQISTGADVFFAPSIE